MSEGDWVCGTCEPARHQVWGWKVIFDKHQDCRKCGRTRKDCQLPFGMVLWDRTNGLGRTVHDMNAFQFGRRGQCLYIPTENSRQPGEKIQHRDRDGKLQTVGVIEFWSIWQACREIDHNGWEKPPQFSVVSSAVAVRQGLTANPSAKGRGRSGKGTSAAPAYAAEGWASRSILQPDAPPTPGASSSGASPLFGGTTSSAPAASSKASVPPPKQMPGRAPSQPVLPNPGAPSAPVLPVPTAAVRRSPLEQIVHGIGAGRHTPSASSPSGVAPLLPLSGKKPPPTAPPAGISLARPRGISNPRCG